jgi:hypothetical protein
MGQSRRITQRQELWSSSDDVNGLDLTNLPRGAGVDACVAETRFGSGRRVERFFEFD